MIDPTDASTVLPEIRLRALDAALDAIERVLAEAEISLDFFGRLDLLEVALDDAHDEFTKPKVN